MATKEKKVLNRDVDWTDEHTAIIKTTIEEPYLDAETGEPAEGCETIRTISEKLTIPRIVKAQEANNNRIKELESEIYNAEQREKNLDKKFPARVQQLRADLKLVREMDQLDKERQSIKTKKGQLANARTAKGVVDDIYKARKEKYPEATVRPDQKAILEAE